MSAEIRGPSPACAFVKIGFDRRAWPTNTPQQAFDGAVRGYADDFRRAAPANAAPRVYTQPGANTMFALFDGTAAEEVLARCNQTLAKFLPGALKLPTSVRGPDGRMRIPSATSVHVPCQLCR
jgi:hypothetical protein